MVQNSDESAHDPLRPLTRPRLYQRLIGSLVDYIALKGLSPGDRLPPERELAGQLRVSRASIRQAIAVLEAQGILAARHGDGTFVARRTSAVDLLAQIRDQRRRLPEVLETREALETKLAELAAERRTSEDLRAIDDTLASMEAEIADGGIGVDGDAAFHHAVTAAAHNSLMAELMSQLEGPIKETRAESLTQPDRPPQSLASHRRIAAAIRAGDARAAAEAMRDHVRLVGDVAVIRLFDPELD